MELRRSLTFILLAACTFVAAQTSPDALYWSRYKERVPLQQDLERIAVQVQSGMVDQVLRVGFPTLGISTTQLERHAVKDQVLITVPLRTEQGMYDLVKNLAQLPEVEFASPVFVDDLGGPMFLTPYVLASFMDGVSAADQAAILKEQDMEKKEEYGALGIFRLHVNATNGYAVLDAANAMAQHATIRSTEPDMIFTGRGEFIPNDPLFGDCWGLLNTGQSGGTAGIDMKATQAWDITTGSASIITVIIDTGSEQTHPDLNQVAGNDFTSDPSSNGDPVNAFDNHGTAVAGCVSATINNALGVSGVAPNTRTAAARAFITINSSGNWNSASSWTVDAINWAVTIGARVTNNSNFYGFTSAAIELAYSTTRDNGMVHFASAGNSAQDALGYPSSLPTVNAVSAIDRTGALASFSNYNSGLAFCAPGADVNTTDRTGAAGYSTTDYTVINGTSFSSPYAAGVAALLLSHVPSLNAIQVEEQMQLTATDLGTTGFDAVFGWGLVNAYDAITTVLAPSNFPCDALPLVLGTNGPFTNVNSGVVPGEAVPPVGSCTGQVSWCTAADNTVWFSFVAPPSGHISINFGSTQNWDSQIALWEVPSCADLTGGVATLLAANDDITGLFPYHAEITNIALTPGQTYYVQVDGYGTTTNNAFELVLVEEAPQVLLQMNVLLGGGYNAATGVMSNTLVPLPDFPTTEPYSAMGYPVIGNAGVTFPPPNVDPSFCTDYAIIELRNAGDPSVVEYNKAVILFRNGQALDYDPTLNSDIKLLVPPGDYFVAVRHRNHLGCMTAAPVTLGTTSTLVDFRSASVLVYGTNARQSVGGAFPAEVLWAGDVTFDGVGRYTGTNNDRDPILQFVGGVVLTNTVTGYRAEDVNLDGVVRYTGSNNDRDPILQTVGGVVPTNSRQEQLP